jgi:hypothetical protein
MTASMPLWPVTKSHRRDDRIAGPPVVFVARVPVVAAPPPPPLRGFHRGRNSIRPAPTRCLGKADFYGRSVDIIKKLSDQKNMPADGRVAHRQDFRLNGQTARHFESY